MICDFTLVLTHHVALCSITSGLFEVPAKLVTISMTLSSETSSALAAPVTKSLFVSLYVLRNISPPRNTELTELFRLITRDLGSSTATSIGTWKLVSPLFSLKVSKIPLLPTPLLVREAYVLSVSLSLTSITAAWDELCPKYNALSAQRKVAPKKGTAI